MRSQKTRGFRRAPGTSGRLHRTEAGDWIWSSDSEPGSSSDSDDETPSAKPPNPLIQKGNRLNTLLVLHRITQQCCAELAEQSENNATRASEMSSNSSCTSEQGDSTPVPPEAQPAQHSEPVQPAQREEHEPINLVLRMRYLQSTIKHWPILTLFRLFFAKEHETRVE